MVVGLKIPALITNFAKNSRKGRINKLKPAQSVKNPGVIKSAPAPAKNIASMISCAGSSPELNLRFARKNIERPSFLRIFKPIIAVKTTNKSVIQAPKTSAAWNKINISSNGVAIKIMSNRRNIYSFLVNR